MANIGIYIEIKDGNFKKYNKETLSLARKSGKDVYAIVFAAEIAPYLPELKGIKKVIHVSSKDAYQPDVYAETLASLILKYELSDFLAAHSARGRDLLPRVAAKIDDAGLVSDCVGLNLEAGKATKPVYGGKLLSDYTLTSACRFYTIRPNVFPAEAALGEDAEVVAENVADAVVKTHIVDIIKSGAAKIDLQEANIIVSGGRGMKDRDGFKLLEELAAVLNAGVGASRAAVDAEFATSDMQVGQTGKVVNPNLYIACGISGAIQHFVGMKTSKIIVAINKDPEAPIFKKADYGVVGDLFKVVPLMTDELKKTL